MTNLTQRAGNIASILPTKAILLYRRRKGKGPTHRGFANHLCFSQCLNKHCFKKNDKILINLKLILNFIGEEYQNDLLEFSQIANKHAIFGSFLVFYRVRAITTLSVVDNGSSQLLITKSG